MARLDPATVDAVMVHVVRCPLVAAQFMAVGVTGASFADSAYEYYALPVDALRQYRAGQQDEPPFPIMEQLCARIAYNHAGLRRCIPPVRAFLARAYAADPAQLRPLYILRPDGPLQQFVDDLIVAPAMRKAAIDLDPERRDRALVELQHLRSRTRVTAAQHVDLFDPEVAARMTELSGRRDTGVDFIDKAIGGVERVTLEGLIAGTAGGKTMFGTMRCCESVLRGRNTAMFQYEQTLAGNIAERFYSYVTGAEKDEVERPWAEYSDSLKERIAAMRPLFRKHFRLFGMAGDIANQGGGGVPEMDNLLRRLRESEGWAPELVIVDWLEPLWMAWDRDRPRNTKDKREEYKYIIGGLKGLRDAWACNVLLLHQIAPGHMERLTPAMKPDKTMAEEVKAFPNMMNYCYCFGKKDDVTDCMWFVVSKGRTTGNPARIVRMDAARNRIVDAHGLFRLNEAHNIAGEAAFVARRDAV